ncbi:MAG: BTAD domain-containing putative transcriptional regulator, partial [Chloroflexota bacterium]
DEESCREAVGVADPKLLLSAVEGAGLPVVRPAGHDLPLYFEPLFRSALEQELSRLLLAHELRSLRERVASYYAAGGEPSEALERYLQMGAFEEAARLLEDAAESELAQGRLDLVLRWLGRLPAAVRNAHPRLMLQEARLHLSRDRLAEARVLLVAAQPTLESLEDPTSRAQQLGGWAALRLLEGRYPEAARLAADALEQLPANDSAERAEVGWLRSRALELAGDLALAFSEAGEGLLEAERSGQPQLIARALLQAGRLAHSRGDYSRSLALSGRAVHRAVLQGSEILAVNSAGSMASVAYLERALLEESLEVAKGALAGSQRLRDPAGQVRALLALSSALERAGEGDRGREMLDQALEMSAKLPGRQPERTLALQTSAASLLRMGRRREAQQRARLALQAAAESSHQLLIDQCSLMVAATEMAGIELPSAIARIRRLNDAFSRSDGRRWLSAGHRLLAEGYGRLGLRWLARAQLRHSLALSAEGSWVGMPLGMPSQGPRLLSLAVREGVAHETAATLLGVDPAEGERVLAPLLAHKNPVIGSRAEQAAKGMEKRLGRASVVKLIWPGLDPAGARDRPVVSLYALGRLAASVEGQPVELPSVDTRNLAAYLLVRRGAEVPREQLLDDLWPLEKPWMANVRLHEALFRIREALGPGFPAVDPELDGEGVYRWGGDGCAIDAELFRERVGRARQLLGAEVPPILPGQVVTLLEEAVDLYRGEFLDGFEFGWCEAPREELRGLLLWATRLLMAHYMAAQRWREAIPHGQKSLVCDPLQEDVVRDLMVCHFQVGDRQAVDRLYRETKRLLARGRGEWPAEETRRLRLRLLGSEAGWARSDSRQPSVLVVGKGGVGRG